MNNLVQVVVRLIGLVIAHLLDLRRRRVLAHELSRMLTAQPGPARMANGDVLSDGTYQGRGVSVSTKSGRFTNHLRVQLAIDPAIRMALWNAKMSKIEGVPKVPTTDGLLTPAVEL